MNLPALALTALLAAAQQGGGGSGSSNPATPPGGQTGTGQTGGVGSGQPGGIGAQDTQGEVEDESSIPSQRQADQHIERARRRRTLRQQGSQPQFDLNRTGGQADEPIDAAPGTQPPGSTDISVPGGQQRQ